MKGSIYCDGCICTKEAKEFSEWIELGGKPARRCNKCRANIKTPESEEFAERLKCKELMADERHSKLTPVQLNYSGSEYAKNRLKTRREIEKHWELKKIQEDLCD